MEEVKEIEGLYVGRIVHYVVGEGQGKYPGEHRPAIIVNLWSKISGCSNLQVFMDSDGEGGFNDERPNVVWQTSINHSAEKEPHTWHFIEEE